MSDVSTKDIIRLIGTPFISEFNIKHSGNYLEKVYEKAFSERIAPLFLYKIRNKSLSAILEEKINHIQERERMTRIVLLDLAANLNNWDETGYSIFKSIKPYPAIPNDTDVIIFGGKKKFESALSYLYDCGYIFHEWAPMQTTLYDPRGKGKIGKGKKGGTYYIDVYSDISTDYFQYIDKASLLPFIENINMNGTVFKNLQKEIELAIILFHNVFPERTFQLEHFYMPLWHLKDDDFDIQKMINFIEKQRLSHAIASNLTIVDYLHKKAFGFVPDVISQLLNQWGRNDYELDRFQKMGEKTPYLFSQKTYWLTFSIKLKDSKAMKSLFLQGIHMLNPIFFLDVVKSLRNRLSEKGIYHLE